ncbi:hypothetical protein BD289DRAFT_128363 [Coniella lustricola]|uniref:Uncharacterized protein n=1 Tax=Coniella lustricola TaxID=2025994 RepID=A0A2T2ZW59_9PEZI|nr:hypothetical protein BD289DRAFT_128363 [Coniella lustricola]
MTSRHGRKDNRNRGTSRPKRPLPAIAQKKEGKKKGKKKKQPQPPKHYLAFPRRQRQERNPRVDYIDGLDFTLQTLPFMYNFIVLVLHLYATSCCIPHPPLAMCFLDKGGQCAGPGCLRSEIATLRKPCKPRYQKVWTAAFSSRGSQRPTTPCTDAGGPNLEGCICPHQELPYRIGPHRLRSLLRLVLPHVLH